MARQPPADRPPATGCSEGATAQGRAIGPIQVWHLDARVRGSPTVRTPRAGHDTQATHQALSQVCLEVAPVRGTRALGNGQGESRHLMTA